MKFVQSFHLQRRLKIENLSLISVTCLPKLRNVKMFPRDFVVTYLKAMEAQIKEVTGNGLKYFTLLLHYSCQYFGFSVRLGKRRH